MSVIQWADYDKDHHEVGLKGSDFQTVVCTINLIGRKVWHVFSIYKMFIHF